jgi:hypothetical protein
MRALIISSFLFLVPTSFIERIGQVQVRDISGKVIGFDDSLPIEGVTVTIKGTHTSTGTQADGTFYIRVPAPEDGTLIFQAAGYKTKELKLTKRNDYDVVLERSGS